MSAGLWTAIQGTMVLWLVSGALSCLLALVLTLGSLSTNRFAKATSRSMVNFTRGVPTSLFVIAAGITMFRLPVALDLPTIYPGTPDAFQHVAWGIAVALAAGSAGHLAEIFRSARAALGHFRLNQATALGLSRFRRAVLLAREAAVIALAPTGTRLVHHLHNSAFAALFPVTDLFGFVQAQANATFRVLDYALLGCLVYVALSALVWLTFRGVEGVLAHRVIRGRRLRAVVA
jgi:ABC-type arginine/histidine transport system permease subunit